MDAYKIQHIKTGLYSPQANSSERVNREIISKIRVFVGEKHTDWDKYVSTIASTLRSDYHSSINSSPYYALFGQNMILSGGEYPILKKLKALADPEIKTIPSADRMHLIRTQVKENLNKAHMRAERIYNRRATNVRFVEGQEVFRRNFGQSSFSKEKTAKFMPKFLK